MKAWLILTILIFSNLGYAQSGRSQKLYTKGEEAIRARNFKEGKEFYKKAIDADESYGAPYLRLVSLYNIYKVKDSALLYLEKYSEVVPVQKINAKVWQQIAQLNYELGKYERAKKAIAKLKPFGNWTDELIRLEKNINFSILQKSQNKSLTISELPDSINKYALQYFPVLTVDERLMFFTKRDGSSVQFDEDIVVSTYKEGEWSSAISISDEINSDFNEGACTVSADGRTLIFTACDGARETIGSCDLYISYRNGSDWSEPENMGSQVNSPRWDSQPSLSADGRTLFFSSDRPGGYGKRDIWKSQYKNNHWTKPKNLGASVNSIFDEATPFIHANNRTLFYSSTGFNNMGGFDLFVVKKKTDSTWTYPLNLGYPINSHHDELSLFVTASGKRAYYAKESKLNFKNAESRIVSYPLEMDTLIQSATYVTGLVTDKSTHAPLHAGLEMVNLSEPNDVYTTTSDSLTGRYFLVLNESTEYGVFVDKKNYLFEDFNFRAKSKDAQRPDTVNIELAPLQSGTSIVLENIYFDFDKFLLSEKSTSELNGMVRYLKNNNSLQFVIEGHTDNRGGNEYNQKLSTKRAESVYNFLINQGIKGDRMDFIGYGSSKPLDPSDQKINRRIEFRIK